MVEFKVVTYIDLLTSVAGVPSFLLIIYRFLMKEFEKFYSDYRIYQTFIDLDDESSKEPPPVKKFQRNFGSSIFQQLCVFLRYENPLMSFCRKRKCCKKLCKKKSKVGRNIDSIKDVAKVLSKNLDLSKILIQLNTFELNMSTVLKKLRLGQGSKIDKHDLMKK